MVKSVLRSGEVQDFPSTSSTSNKEERRHFTIAREFLHTQRKIPYITVNESP